MPELTDSPVRATRRCASCGGSLSATARFCSACGTSTAPQPPAIKSWAYLSGALTLWILLLIVIGVSGIISAESDETSPMHDLYASSVFAAVVLVFCLSRKVRVFANHRWAMSWYQLALTFAVTAACLGFSYGYFKGAEALGIQTLGYLETFEDHGWPLWAAFALTAAFPAVFEELAFRGYIQAALGMVGSAREALFIQAAMFSVLHLSPAVFISHFVLGLAFGWLRMRTGSLVPCMLAHGTYNSMVLVEEMIVNAS